jgi:hypothetical protein
MVNASTNRGAMLPPMARVETDPSPETDVEPEGPSPEKWANPTPSKIRR